MILNPRSLDIRSASDKFRKAALSKLEGAVYYADVIAALRDQFIGNDDQIPFFVSQCTGREVFVEDAHRLDNLREELKQNEAAGAAADNAVAFAPPVAPPTLVELLRSGETNLATSGRMEGFVDELFDGLRGRLAQGKFSEVFEIEFAEHDEFREQTTKRFINRSSVSREAAG